MSFRLEHSTPAQRVELRVRCLGGEGKYGLLTTRAWQYRTSQQVLDEVREETWSEG